MPFPLTPNPSPPKQGRGGKLNGGFVFGIGSLL
jgi:hypothetical protein